MADSKEDIVKRGYQAFGEGDMATLGGLYTDAVVQTMAGNNQLAGEHTGRDNVLALYGKMFELSGGTFSADLKSVKTEGDKVVSTHSAQGERDGKTLADEETITFSFSGEISRL